MNTRFEIKQNKWDNWHGYRNGRRVAEFANTPSGSQYDHAIAWLNDMHAQHVEQDLPIQAGDGVNWTARI